MIRLDEKSRSLVILLGGAVTTSQLEVMVCYSDKGSKLAPSFKNRTKFSTTNGATPVTICDAPNAVTIREIDFVSVHNADTVAATVTIRMTVGSSNYTVVKVTLAAGEGLSYEANGVWQVLGTDGRQRMVFTGDITVVGSGKRFFADFSNATRANRFLFQDSTTNNGTNVGAIPNGTSNVAAWTAFGGSDPDNTHFITITTSATATMLNSTAAGTGTQRSLDLQIGGATKVSVPTGGGLKIANASAPTVAANEVGFGTATATTVGAAGAASALPANPVGYLIVNIAGTDRKVPYYNT